MFALRSAPLRARRIMPGALGLVELGNMAQEIADRVRGMTPEAVASWFDAIPIDTSEPAQ